MCTFVYFHYIHFISFFFFCFRHFVASICHSYLRLLIEDTRETKLKPKTSYRHTKYIIIYSIYSKKLEYYTEKYCAQSSNCVYVYIEKVLGIRRFAWHLSEAEAWVNHWIALSRTNHFQLKRFTTDYLSILYAYIRRGVYRFFRLPPYILWHLKKRQQNSSSNRTAFMMSIKLILLQFEIHTHTYTIRFNWFATGFSAKHLPIAAIWMAFVRWKMHRSNWEKKATQKQMLILSCWVNQWNAIIVASYSITLFNGSQNDLLRPHNELYRHSSAA